MFKKLTASISLLLLSCLLLAGCQFGAVHPKGPHFERTGDMNIARWGHAATLLKNGKVLIAGGVSEYPHEQLAKQAELYNPKTKKFTLTGTMIVPYYHLKEDDPEPPLLSNGKVFFIGREGSHAELYDSKTGQFSLSGTMIVPYRECASVTLLRNGKILIAGGKFYPDRENKPLISAITDSAELYDPQTGKFSLTGKMILPRMYHTATRLADGRVLIAGGVTDHTHKNDQDMVEIYDPQTGKFSVNGKLLFSRLNYQPVLLSNNNVLFFGGDGSHESSISNEIYNPKTGKSIKSIQLNQFFLRQTATPLLNHKFLFTGGHNYSFGSNGTYNLAELYDPISSEIEFLKMNERRDNHTATLLSDGKVLITGGQGEKSSTPSKTAEMFLYN